MPAKPLRVLGTGAFAEKRRPVSDARKQRRHPDQAIVLSEKVSARAAPRIVFGAGDEGGANRVELDIRAPLVMRMDRASSHETAAVHEVLHEHEVLLLHGPPRYPQYYGQHERQNREHQGWLAYSESVDDLELERMRRVLNERWLRLSLGWRSAAAVWAERRPLRTNCRELRRDVVRRTVQLRTRLGPSLVAQRRAEGLAIEEALEDRGLIRRIAGGR